MPSEVDGNVSDAVAICGFSIKFPQEATSADAFWEMIVRRKCTMTEFPADRISLSGFQSSNKKRNNTFSVRGGHFIKEDLSLFDADFFNISPTEAAAMDPMQRWLLEAAYQALQNSGISMEAVSGTSTGVYTGCFTNDYMTQLYRDPECTPAYMATGVGTSMLANRISWFFNFHGPSLKTASCDLSMVAGCNLTFAPELYQSMSNMNFLSPDSLCYSFDERANGYSRGEGIAVIILKRLSDAIRDGNTVRAVIRATGSNEDGRTAGITQPSGQAQEQLIRETYRKAALSMAHTRYFEAHGTGTPMGDPIEALAVGKAFGDFRSEIDPLYMGAVKSNIGHLEGASALAGVIKAVLVLEKGVIPPNANFEKLNPKIDDKSLGLKFPEKCYSWPTPGLRRASINSFGYGGSNSHIVLDDAYNFMHLRDPCHAAQ
ncbi:polyketide synthase [Cryphonectria parasitica EP155]|uniref:Polyketide synthase n=1 Tax=Cryphonectria parasitica (strain ATCC 38755 / EP155) TaxID=660469 RepID=A0A9P4Y845_CRYP1|nr:polyketide synthase [Cryphonectria parasitica EP155]KAF3768164.1 polyketide synthase [Cryphonectria parasitica EP155]